MSSAGTVLEHPVVAGVRDAVAGLTGPCGAPTWQLSDAEVETGLACVLDLEAKAAALRAGLLREAEVRDLHSRTRAPSVEHWLGDRFRLSRADAAARMRSASVLGRHPTVEAALARGEVTVEQATVVTAALDRVALLRDIALFTTTLPLISRPPSSRPSPPRLALPEPTHARAHRADGSDPPAHRGIREVPSSAQ